MLGSVTLRTHLPPVRVLRRAVLPEHLLGSVYQDHFTSVTVRSLGKGERPAPPPPPDGAHQGCAMPAQYPIPLYTGDIGYCYTTYTCRSCCINSVTTLSCTHCTCAYVCTAADTATLRCYVVLTQQQQRSVMQYTLLRCLHTLYVYGDSVCTCTTTACTRCCIAYACTRCAAVTPSSCCCGVALLHSDAVGFSWGMGRSPRRPKAFARHTPRYCTEYAGVYSVATHAAPACMLTATPLHCVLLRRGRYVTTCMRTYSLHSRCLASLWCTPRACGAMHVTTFPCAMHRLPAYACRHMLCMCTCTLCTSRYAPSCPHAAPACILMHEGVSLLPTDTQACCCPPAGGQQHACVESLEVGHSAPCTWTAGSGAEVRSALLLSHLSPLSLVGHSSSAHYPLPVTMVSALRRVSAVVAVPGGA